MEDLPKELIIHIISYLNTSSDISNFLDAYTSSIFRDIKIDNSFMLLTQRTFPLIFPDINNIINDTSSSWMIIYGQLIDSIIRNASYEGMFKNEGLYTIDFDPMLPNVLYRAVFNKYFPKSYQDLKHKSDIRQTFIEIPMGVNIAFIIKEREDLFKFMYSNKVATTRDRAWRNLIDMIRFDKPDLLVWTLQRGERSHIHNIEFEDDIDALTDHYGEEYMKKFIDILYPN